MGRPIELVARLADGLPGGSAEAVVDAFGELVDAGVVAIVGPSISDNGIIVRDLCDETGLPCINYTGGAITRSRWMFHYQVGSLEEEPPRAGGPSPGPRAASRRGAPRRHARRHQLRHVVERAVPSAGGRRGRPPDRGVAHGGGPRGRGAAPRWPASPDALVYLGLGVAARAVALGVASVGWTGPVVANSALMFGYSRREWRAGWDGWVYVDTISDANPVRAALRERSKAHAGGPIGVAASTWVG